jgi:hypothetical protein
MTKKILGLRYMITGGAVVLATGLGTVGVASAATSHAATTITVKSPAAAGDWPDGAPGSPHGTPPAALTGTTLTSAVAAANAAVPDATVLGTQAGPNGTYLVHLKEADDTYATVVENSSFVVTSTVKDLAPGPGDHLGDPATLTHGPGETLLTGATATSAVASANAAVPGATVVRAETDAQGATYEVHLKKADGTYVTVKENASFVVTSTQAGFGTPPAGDASGPRLPDGTAPSGAAGSSN